LKIAPEPLASGRSSKLSLFKGGRVPVEFHIKNTAPFPFQTDPGADRPFYATEVLTEQFQPSGSPNGGFYYA
jgi:hypothetical protein